MAGQIWGAVMCDPALVCAWRALRGCTSTGFGNFGPTRAWPQDQSS